MKEIDYFDFARCCDYFASTNGVILEKTKVPLAWREKVLKSLKKQRDSCGDYELAAEEMSMRGKCVVIAAVIQQIKETGNSNDWLISKGTFFLEMYMDEIPENLVRAAEYLIVHGRMPSKKYINDHAPYKLKVVLSDVHYVYSGYPHDDERFEVSVWKGDRAVPIGDIVRVMHGSAVSEEDAIAEKYGKDFAKTLSDAMSVFNEEWQEEIDEDMRVYSRVSGCCRDDTELLHRELKGRGIEVEDVRSEKSKQIENGLYKLMTSVQDNKHITELLAQGKLTRAEVVKILIEAYDVCEDAARYYVSEYCN